MTRAFKTAAASAVSAASAHLMAAEELSRSSRRLLALQHGALDDRVLAASQMIEGIIAQCVAARNFIVTAPPEFPAEPDRRAP